MNPLQRIKAMTYERWMLLLTFLWMIGVSIIVIDSLNELDENVHQQLIINETILANIEDCLNPEGQCTENQEAITNASRRYGNQVALFSAYCAVAQVAEQRATVITVSNIQRCVDDLVAEERRRTQGGEFPSSGLGAQRP